MTTPVRRGLHLLALIACSAGAAQPVATESGLDAQELKEVPARLEPFVEDGTIAGAVTLVAYYGRFRTVIPTQIGQEPEINPDTVPK